MSQTKVQLIKDGALAEDSIVHDGDTNTKIRFSGTDTITAETAGVERLRINSTGQTIVGDSVAQLSTSSERPFQVHSINGPKIALGRNDTSISTGNTIGGIEFYGNDSDGTFKNTATIVVNADDTHTTNSKATRMQFFTTTNNDATPTEHMRLNNAGTLLLGASAYGGGGSDPILYISSTSGRQVKIHNTNSATTSLQLTNGATGQGEDQGMQLAALANGECGIFNAEAERILIQSQEDDNNKPVVNFIKPAGPSAAQTTMIAFETGNQGRGAVLSSSSDGGSPSFAALSDYRIKTNIRDYTDGYNNIKAIPVKLFDMVSDGTKDIKGWIAHEVQAHIPEAVMGVKDAVDGDENPILQQLSYGLFMPDVVSALQTAIAKIEVLETKVAALESA